MSFRPIRLDVTPTFQIQDWHEGSRHFTGLLVLCQVDLEKDRQLDLQLPLIFCALLVADWIIITTIAPAITAEAERTPHWDHRCCAIADNIYSITNNTPIHLYLFTSICLHPCSFCLFCCFVYGFVSDFCALYNSCCLAISWFLSWLNYGTNKYKRKNVWLLEKQTALLGS
jgi:hypothetical protein